MKISYAFALIPALIAGVATAQTVQTPPVVVSPPSAPRTGATPTPMTPAPMNATPMITTPMTPAPMTPAPMTNTTTPPLPGANSYTLDQARRLIEDNGFTAVSGLRKDEQSIWRATAMKNGASKMVSVDFKGNVVAQ